MTLYRKGLLIVYTGDGKGKTTAALGLAARAAGWGGRVKVIEFIKGERHCGEHQHFHTSPVRIQTTGKGFVFEKPDKTAKEAFKAVWHSCLDDLRSGDYDLVILDEVHHAVNLGFIGKFELLKGLTSRARCTTVVCTGRNAPKSVINAADICTQMSEIKHCFKKTGTLRGIDY